MNRALLVLWLVLVILACTRTKVEYVTVEKRIPCLKYPPGRLHPWTGSAGGEGDCPAQFGVCFSDLDMAALEINFRYLIRRVVDDWELCGVKDATP